MHTRTRVIGIAEDQELLLALFGVQTRHTAKKKIVNLRETFKHGTKNLLLGWDFLKEA